MVLVCRRLAQELPMGRSLRAGFGICLAAWLVGGAGAGLRAQEVTASGAGEASPGVRIVRLSAVRGKVELDRRTGRGFEAGFMNLPIVQGNRLRTVGLGWAEVEFEDGGSARMTPDTQVDFGVLARGADGQLRNELTLEKGTLYVSRMKGDKSDLVVIAGAKKVILPPESHVRLDVYPAGSELVVVKGTARVEDESGSVTVVDRSHALKFGGPEGTQLVRAKDEAPGLYDRWDADAADYHKNFAGGGGSANLSGAADLQYYGTFVNLGGCGSVWRPYLASAAFDPAGSGVWVWYPGSGYTFVSPYAWGWTTFNSGSWVSCGGQGWGWRRGTWVGMKNHGIVEPIKGPGHRPRPVDEPAAGKPTFVNAGEHGMIRSRVTVNGASQFERDSAGIGVPRGAISNLKQISKAVAAGKPGTEPNYAGDTVAKDPLTLTLLGKGTEVALRAGAGAAGGGVELARSASRPVASPVVTGGHAGGYAGGGPGFAHSSPSAGASSGGGNAWAGGGRSSGTVAPVSTSSSGTGSSAAAASAGSSSTHH
jgi:hypothetical protein